MALYEYSVKTKRNEKGKPEHSYAGERNTTESTDEAIKRIVLKSIKPEKSMAGSLAKYVGKLSKKEILKDLRDKSDRI